MPEIKPFKAWRYDSKKVSNLANVLAPPYDVISKKEQEALHDKSPYNAIRLELGKDTTGENKYQRAARVLGDWKKQGVLVREADPSIYVYTQDYLEGKTARRRFGFLAAMKIDERAVLKHENTLAAPKKDRMSLLKEVRTNLSPIFGLFEDKGGATHALLKKMASGKPFADVTVDGVRHRLYIESDSASVNDLCRRMKARPMFIADGHHRFEVACQYKKWMSGRSATTAPAWNYVMTYFCDAANNPFKIFPTHRLVKFPKGMSTPLAALGVRGDIKKVVSLAQVLKALDAYRRDTLDQAYSFGVYTKKDGFHLYKMDKNLRAKVKNNPVDSLDVAVLHQFVIEPLFKIKAIEKSAAIDFTRDPNVAVEKVKSGEFDAAFFLRPTSLNEMLLASKKGLKMPQKSTYFYPKLLTGLAFHGFDE